jgi:hypothetical protein
MFLGRAPTRASRGAAQEVIEVRVKTWLTLPVRQSDCRDTADQSGCSVGNSTGDQGTAGGNCQHWYKAIATGRSLVSTENGHTLSKETVTICKQKRNRQNESRL